MKKRYGFIREEEADLIDDLLSTLKKDFGYIRFLEIGVFGGGTVSGIYQKANELKCNVHCEGVDFASWKPNPTPAPDYTFHDGDSMDMWRKITGEFNFLFVDGCHCVNHAMADFLNYSPLVCIGGYCLFHDTAVEQYKMKQEEWPQDHSYAGKPPSILGVREGLKKIGILQGYRSDWALIKELPSPNGLMGMCLFKKLKAL